METFWDTLGIKPTTDTKKIRKAYSALVKIHNPEDDEEKFRKINGAYKAAMKFAANFERLDVSDEQIQITDVRPDGSFGVKFFDKDGKPLFPEPPKTTPDKDPSFEPKKEEEPEHVEDKLFDFDSIDSSVVKAFTYEEAIERAGMITFAIGFAVPDSPKTRQIKKFLDDNNIVKAMSNSVTPGDESEGASEALRIAELFIDNGMSDEKVLWQFYFLSPLVMSLRTDLGFYTELEQMINLRKLTGKHAFAISEGSPFHPRIYNIVKRNQDTDPYTIDFISRVPFRYKSGKYPQLENMMKKEKPDEFKALTDFLSKVSLNIYGVLMPAVRPFYKYVSQDASAIFDFIMTSPECKDMKKNRLLWKLFFKSNLVKPVINDPSFHHLLTTLCIRNKCTKDVIRVIKKEMSEDELVFMMKVKDTKDNYSLYFIPSLEGLKSSHGRLFNRNEKLISIVLIAVFMLLLFAATCHLHNFAQNDGTLRWFF